MTRSALRWWGLGVMALLFAAGPWPFNPACHVWSYGQWAWTNGGMWMAPKHWIDLGFHLLQAVFAWTSLTLAIAEAWQARARRSTNPGVVEPVAGASDEVAEESS